MFGRTHHKNKTRYQTQGGSMIPLPPYGSMPGTILTEEANLGSPGNENQQILGVDPNIYAHYPGDVFLPGSGNWVYEPRTERTPLQTTWGNAFLVGFACYFKPLQPPQVYASPTVVQNGLGGLFAGQYVGQPLLYDDSVTAIEQGSSLAPNASGAVGGALAPSGL